MSNVRSTHESLDPIAAKQLHTFYETMIDFGAHPNQMGLMTAMSKSATEKDITYNVGILFLDTVTIAAIIRMAAGVAIGTLKVFQLIFPERFQLMSLDREIEALLGKLNRVFKTYAPKG